MKVDFFKLVKDKDEKLKIYSEIISNKHDVVAKSLEPDTDLFLFEPMALETNLLICHLKGTNSSGVKSSKLIVQFFTGEEKYLSQMDCEKFHASVSLDTAAELYHMQRREDFRLKIPRSMDGYVQVNRIDNKRANYRWPLIDLSAGGCRLQAPGTLVPRDGKFEGIVNIKGRMPFPIVGSIKHSIPTADDPLEIYAGVQFGAITNFSKDRLVALMMDLYRDLFYSLA